MIVDRLHANGTMILMVEQNSKVALKFADCVYVLDAGRIALKGKAYELLHDDSVVRTYLGGGAPG